MAKYRKKPVVIEAFQMTKERSWDNSEWPNWLNMAWICGTLEGVHRITFNDWIIQGVKGEIYPCKNEIFHLTYEKVDEE